jgi:hypothetical protein
LAVSASDDEWKFSAGTGLYGLNIKGDQGGIGVISGARSYKHTFEGSITGGGMTLS